MDQNIMSFNMRLDTPEDGKNNWKHRIEQVVKMIKRHEPVIVGTQEGWLPMLKELEPHLSDYTWIGEGRRGGLEDEFCAIFYNHKKLKCVEHGQFWLSTEPETPNSISWNSAHPRICTWGHFRLKADPSLEFMFYNTHLDHESEEARDNGALLVWRRMKEKFAKNQLPMMLTGDFNSVPDSKAIQFLGGEIKSHGKQSELKNAYETLDEPVSETFHEFAGGDVGVTIDYIFYSSNVIVKQTTIDRSKIDGRYPSDHYPVVATVQFES